jgi:hypothetical protein
MMSCCPHSQFAGRLFSRFSRRYRRRFKKKGFEPSQRQLLEGVERAGIANAAILEIGSGVGYLHQYLLQRGSGVGERSRAHQALREPHAGLADERIRAGSRRETHRTHLGSRREEAVTHQTGISKPL